MMKEIKEIFKQEKDYLIKQEDSWIILSHPEEYSNDVVQDFDFSDVGYKTFIIDRQYLILDDIQADYFFVSKQALTPSSLNMVSQFNISFMPGFQKVAIHKIQIKRGSQVFDRVPSSHFKLDRSERINEGELGLLK